MKEITAEQVVRGLLEDDETTYVHLLKTRGGSVCGATSGESYADINWVTCPKCLKIYDAEDDGTSESLQEARAGRQVTILIETDNEAFTDEPSLELARILQSLASGNLNPGDSINIRDINGNTVGSFRWT